VKQKSEETFGEQMKQNANQNTHAEYKNNKNTTQIETKFNEPRENNFVVKEEKPKQTRAKRYKDNTVIPNTEYNYNYS